jgi:hypothetical protein
MMLPRPPLSTGEMNGPKVFSCSSDLISWGPGSLAVTQVERKCSEVSVTFNEIIERIEAVLWGSGWVISARGAERETEKQQSSTKLQASDMTRMNLQGLTVIM